MRWVTKLVFAFTASTGLTAAHAAEPVRTLAGAPGISGQQDGVGGIARFADPAGLAMDSAGNILIADSGNHCLRMLTPSGTVSTFAGIAGDPGATDGTAATARFDTPSSLALASDGTLFISDTGNHTVRRLDLSGRVTTFAGSAGSAGATDGTATTARFNSPLGLAIAVDGSLFVADSGNHAIRRIDSKGTVTTFAGNLEGWGSSDGNASTARFNGPVGLAFDPAGNLFVADSFNHAIRRITPNGTVTTFAGKLGEDGFLDGAGGEARFGTPAELALDRRGNLFVADAFYHTLRKITPSGQVSTIAGLAGADGNMDGAYSASRFFNPYGLVSSPSGSLILSDTYNETVREVVAPFALSVRSAGKDSPVIQWESVPGQRYQVYQRDTLAAPWTPMGAPVTASLTTTEVRDTASQPTRFYQVDRVP